MSYRHDVIHYHAAMESLGFDYDTAEAIRRDAQRLHTWAEHECNGTKIRADVSDNDHKGRPLKVGRTYMVWNINGPGPLRYSPTPDIETGALRRIAAACEANGATFEHQGDPRGWPIRITKNGITVAPPCRY